MAIDPRLPSQAQPNACSLTLASYRLFFYPSLYFSSNLDRVVEEIVDIRAQLCGAYLSSGKAVGKLLGPDKECQRVFVEEFAKSLIRAGRPLKPLKRLLEFRDLVRILPRLRFLHFYFLKSSIKALLLSACFFRASCSLRSCTLLTACSNKPWP